MINLALLIFIYVLSTQTISWIGKSVLQNITFSAYSNIFLSSTARKQSTLRRQVLSDKAELARTSSQDEFAKWAKLKRKVDKSLADLEKINTQLGTAKSGFNTKFSTILWLFTTGAQLILVWWYRKEAVFWLPRGWVPGPVRWVLSLPSAPRGSVSSGAWCAVCKRVLTTGEEIVKDLLTPVTGGPIPTQPIPASSQPKNQSAKIETIELEHDKLD